MAGWELAQLNLATWAVDPTSRAARSFRRQVDAVNAAGAASPGFRWRSEDDRDGPWGAGFLHNLTVWDDPSSLRAFVFGDELHASVMRDRRRWFLPTEEPTTVLWWVPVDHRPSLEEADDRLGTLRRVGVTPAAFGLHDDVPAPS